MGECRVCIECVFVPPGERKGMEKTQPRNRLGTKRARYGIGAKSFHDEGAGG